MNFFGWLEVMVLTDFSAHLTWHDQFFMNLKSNHLAKEAWRFKLKIQFEECSLKIQFEEKRAFGRLVEALKSEIFIWK